MLHIVGIISAVCCTPLISAPRWDAHRGDNVGSNISVKSEPNSTILYFSLCIRGGLDGFESWKNCTMLYYFTSGPLVVRTATPLVWCCPAPSSCPCLLLRCPARCMCRPKSSSSICSRLQCLKQLTLTYSINPSGLWKRQPMWHAITPVEYCLSFVICAVYCKCLVPK